MAAIEEQRSEGEIQRPPLLLSSPLSNRESGRSKNLKTEISKTGAPGRVFPAPGSKVSGHERDKARLLTSTVGRAWILLTGEEEPNRRIVGREQTGSGSGGEVEFGLA
jgi:hypothetical protein